MDKRHLLKMRLHLNVLDGDDFYITRATDIYSSIKDSELEFQVIWFPLHDVYILFSEKFVNTTNLEVAFPKSKWKSVNQVISWLYHYDIRYYNINESEQNIIPEVKEMANADTNSVLCICKHSHNKRVKHLKTLRFYLLQNNVTKQPSDEAIEGIISLLGLSKA